MSSNVIPVEVKAVVPAAQGRAVFIGNDEKIFVIYIDKGVGDAITLFLSGQPKLRPLTHDLIGHLLAAFGAKVERVVINDAREGTFFARLILSAENEIHAKKIVELDARPSDSMAIALQQGAPIFVVREVWDEVEDMSEILEKMQHGSFQEGDHPDFNYEDPDFDPELDDDEDLP